MIPKSQKIKRSLFKEVFLLGKNKNSELFRIKIKKSEAPKFGIVVAKKIYKKAVDRNRIRRIFYNTIKKLNVKPEPAEYIFFAQKNIKDKSKNEIEKDIKNFFEGE